MLKIKQPAILYLAALFHDIAKGRGGDHSELGAEEALIFAQRHHLTNSESDLLVWLVKNHLLMSQTAQRQDIYDPKTIHHFCSLLPKAHYLDYLYLLTVADICATNQALWNAWKDSLLKELYRFTSEIIHAHPQLMNEQALIYSRKQEALTLLQKSSNNTESIEALWKEFKDKYFLHEPASVIALHTQQILECQHFPLVLIMPHHSQGGIEVFIYMPHLDERFTITTTILSNHHTTIQEASILTCDNHFDLDTYIILNEQQDVFLDNNRTEQIKEALEKQLRSKIIPPISKRRLSRTQAHFKLKPQISFMNDEQQQSCLFLVTPDRPGLLATVSGVFLKLGIILHTAKVATAGERAEDMFYISTASGYALTKTEKKALQEDLLAGLVQLYKA